MRDTLIGKTKPNRVTFFLWGVAPLVAYFSQRAGGGGLQTLYTLIIAIVPFLILASSFVNKEAYWAITKFDIACGSISVLALVFLVVSGDAIIALILSMLADFFAALPTLIKSYKFPETETAISYAVEVISSIIVLLTIHHWIFVNYIFAVYILCMCVLFTSLLTFPRKKLA
jgi:hypothetical protein